MSKVYDIVTEWVVKLLEAGTVPWRQPWRTPSNAPQNVISKRPYRGTNAFLLGCLDYVDPRFVSYKQAQGLGGQVRKGEKGWPVVYWGKLEKDKDDPKKRGGMFLRYSTAFNVGQCDGLELPALPGVPEDHDPIAAADAIAENYRGARGPDVRHGGDRACYVPELDAVTVPPSGVFKSAEHYYATLFHELGHSTGHRSRLCRPGIQDVRFGSHIYGEEELVAEMTACFLCAEAGIGAATIDDHASYVGSWLRTIRGDARLVVVAAGQAQKAAALILGRAAGAESEAA